MDGDLAVAKICLAGIAEEAETALAILADIDRRYETLSHRVDVQRGQTFASLAALKSASISVKESVSGLCIGSWRCRPGFRNWFSMI